MEELEQLTVKMTDLAVEFELLKTELPDLAGPVVKMAEVHGKNGCLLLCCETLEAPAKCTAFFHVGLPHGNNQGLELSSSQCHSDLDQSVDWSSENRPDHLTF